MTAFAPIDHAARVRHIDERLTVGDLGCDALLFTNLVDVRWLTGFTGSNGWAVVRPGSLIFGTDMRYGDRAKVETAASGAAVVAFQDRARLHREMVEALAGAEAVGLDATTTTQASWTKLIDDVNLQPVMSPVGAARLVKDEAEIERMSAAAASADLALAEVEPMLMSAGETAVTEADIRNELEYRMRLHGADDRSYDTIVASGPDHAARPHHEVGGRRIADGDTIVIDVGGLVEGYHSDMTRSYVVGEATAQQREIYGLVERSQQAGLDAVREGVTAQSVDSACRDVFVDAGYGDWYIHGTGHGVGLEIHESPFHSQTSTETITTNNVVTVEPGLYRVGFGGFRIEDLVVVTETGHRVLTHSPKRSLS